MFEQRKATNRYETPPRPRHPSPSTARRASAQDKLGFAEAGVHHVWRSKPEGEIGTSLRRCDGLCGVLQFKTVVLSLSCFGTGDME